MTKHDKAPRTSVTEAHVLKNVLKRGWQNVVNSGTERRMDQAYRLAIADAGLVDALGAPLDHHAAATRSPCSSSPPHCIAGKERQPRMAQGPGGVRCLPGAL